MANRHTETAATLDAFAEGASGGSLPLHQYEFLFEMTTQLLASQKLEEQMSLVLDRFAIVLLTTRQKYRVPPTSAGVIVWMS